VSDHARELPAARSHRRGRLGVAIPPLLAVAGTGSLVLAFPPCDWGGVGWVAAAPLFALALGPWPRPGLWGWLAGFGFFLAHLCWMAPFTVPGWILSAGISGAWFGLALGLARRAAAKAAPTRRPLLAAMAWTAIEWLRSLGPLGLTWGDLAVSQHRFPVVLQMLDLAGSFGLSFLMAWVAAALAAALVEGGSVRKRLALLAPPLAVTVVLLARGAWLLSRPSPPAPTLRVAVIQASTSYPSAASHVDVRTVPEDYLRWSETAARDGARLIVWGEAAAWDDLTRGLPATSAVAAFLRRHPVWLLTGGDYAPDPDRLYNSAYLLAGGRVVDRYDKIFLVPMGEYVPFRALWPRAVILGAVRRDFTPGRAARPLRDGDLAIAAAICFESAFGRLLRDAAQEGANLIALLSSDGWVDRWQAAGQHEAMAPLRAVELRRAVARASNSGISCLVDPFGRRIATVAPFRHGYAIADLPLRRERTLYLLLGDWPGYLAAGGLLLALLRRRRGRTPARG